MKIFFDIDGVLIDGWHADESLRKPWDSTIETDLSMDRKAFRQLFFGTPDSRSSAPMHACTTGQRDLKDALAEVLPKTGYTGDIDTFVRYWFQKDSNVNPEVLALVQTLRKIEGTQTFLLTGQEHHRAAYLWNDLGLSQHFDDIFYSAKIGLHKKDPRFFAAINRALSIAPDEQPIYFDDQPEIVALAHDTGWDATAFRSANDIRQHPRLIHLWPPVLS